jgi:hypothetical protein
MNAVLMIFDLGSFRCRGRFVFGMSDGVQVADCTGSGNDSFHRGEWFWREI